MEINEILSAGSAAMASDIFLSAGKVPAFRKNGVIEPQKMPPLTAAGIDSFRQTVLTGVQLEQYQKTQAGDAAYTVENMHFRLNFFQTVDGPSIVCRIIRPASNIQMDAMRMPSDLIRKLAKEPRGLILITGSTGSGKSTTMAALVNEINRTCRKHILTIEDPVEFRYQNDQSIISQRELAGTQSSFAEALRNALRENPDVIVIGEMRDADTVATAISAALTGHLVISTLHTSDSVATVERIISLFPADQQDRISQDLSLALTAVFAQRLIPHINGFGMIPAFEILLATSTVRKLVAERDYAGLEDHLKRDVNSGMIPFNRAIFTLLNMKLITQADAMNAVSNQDDFSMLLRGMESGTDSFRNHYGSELDTGTGQVNDMLSLLRSAFKNGASDLILTKDSPPVCRLDGNLMKMELPKLTDTDIQRLLFSVLDQRQRAILEENRELDVALSVKLELVPGKTVPCRFRFNAFYQKGSLGAVARVVNAGIPEPDALGIPPVVTLLAQKKQGLILVTGPTGSGKSTTLASLIQLINQKSARHIITVEDPIEFVHPNLMSIVEQREVHSDTMSFANGLKYALREDPDVIMIGEMRDLETVSAALRAAETGHLVFATLHTNSSSQTVDRIVDSFPPDQQNQIRIQLASVLLCAVSQRLLKRKNATGRVGAFEVLVGTPPVQSLIREGKSYQLPSVLDTSRKDGMIRMESALQYLAKAGMIEEGELERYKHDLQSILID